MELKESIEKLVGKLRHYGQRHNTSRFECHLKSLEWSAAQELTPDRLTEQLVVGARILVFPCNTPAEAARLVHERRSEA